MRQFLAKLLLERILPRTCPDEEFFVAGPLRSAPFRPAKLTLAPQRVPTRAPAHR